MRIGLWVRVWGQNSARNMVSPILLNTEQLISQGFNLHEVLLVTFAHVLQFCIYLFFFSSFLAAAYVNTNVHRPHICM